MVEVLDIVGNINEQLQNDFSQVKLGPLTNQQKQLIFAMKRLKKGVISVKFVDGNPIELIVESFRLKFHK